MFTAGKCRVCFANRERGIAFPPFTFPNLFRLSGVFFQLLHFLSFAEFRYLFFEGCLQRKSANNDNLERRQTKMYRGRKKNRLFLSNRNSVFQCFILSIRVLTDFDIRAVEISRIYSCNTRRRVLAVVDGNCFEKSKRNTYNLASC